MSKDVFEAQIKQLQSDIAAAACPETANPNDTALVEKIRGQFGALLQEIYGIEHNYYKYFEATSFAEDVLQDFRRLDALALIVAQELSVNVVVEDPYYTMNYLSAWVRGIVWLPEYKNNTTDIISELKYMAVLNLVNFVYGTQHKFYTSTQKYFNKFLTKIQKYPDFPRGVSAESIYIDFKAEIKDLEKILQTMDKATYIAAIKLQPIIDLHKNTRIGDIWFPFTKKPILKTT
jgi:hypothetical protein